MTPAIPERPPGLTAPPGRAAAIIALGGQTMIAAITFVIAKHALAAFRPLELAGLRMIGAAILMGSLAAVSRPGSAQIRVWGKKLLFLGLVGVTANQLCFLVGLAHSTPTHAALLYALTPAFVHLMALAAGDESPDRRLALGIVIAMSGAAIVIASRDSSAVMRATLGGDLLILMGVVSWAIYSTRGRAAVRELGALRFTASTLTVGALFSLPITLPGLRNLDATAIPFSAWMGLLFLIVFTSGIAYALWTWALRGLSASQVAVFANAQPVATALLSYAVLGEAISSALILGGSLVLLGVALTQTRSAGAPSPPRRERTTP